MPNTEVLDRLDAAVEALAGVDWDSLTDSEVVEVVRRVETAKRRLAPVDHAAVTQLEQRSVPFTYGARSAAVLLSNLLRITRAEAAARVAAAAALGHRRTVAGDLVAPRFPVVAAAQADGVLSDRHAAVIVRTVDGLPDQLADEFGDFVEKTLVDQAAECDPRQLAGHAAALAYALDQDGQLKDAAYRDKHRGLSVHVRPDGSSRVEGDLTAEATAHLLAQLDALTKPHGTAAGPDPRTACQRRHDALLAVLLLVERAELLPNAGGVTATVVLTMDADSWVRGTGTARTGHGYTIPASVAKQWAGFDCQILLALLSRTKAVEAYSSTRRICTQQQRLALVARDGGCTFPDCDAPPSYCEAHHVTEWRTTHRTAVSDLALACFHDHRHHEAMGWQCSMQDDGLPAWIPPKWLDPEQRPRRNTRHHRPE